MKLIGKTLCQTCQEAAAIYVPGVEHLLLDGHNAADALMELAWVEAVELAEKELPILIDGMNLYQGNKAVERLKEISRLVPDNSISRRVVGTFPLDGNISNEAWRDSCCAGCLT